MMNDKNKIWNVLKKKALGLEMRLPPERKLAEELGLSRDCLRRMMRVFKAEGLIESRQGSGNYIVQKNTKQKYRIAVFFGYKANSRDYYYRKISSCIKRASEARKCGFFIIEEVDLLLGDKKGEATLKSLLKENQADAGLIASTMPLENILQIDKIIPSVILNNHLSNYWGGIPYVYADHSLAALLAVRHFVKKGYKRLGYICGKRPFYYSLCQKHIYEEACNLLDIDFLKKDHLKVSLDHQTFITEVDTFFSQTETHAFLVEHDYMASRVIRFLKDNDYHIPEDFAFISVGAFSELINPPIALTTVDLGFDKICETGIHVLINRLQGKTVDYHNLIKPQLIIRESG